MSNKTVQPNIISLLDLTSLNDADDKTSIDALCSKAITNEGSVAAICVYPRFVKQVACHPEACSLRRRISIATVINFPQGNDSLEKVINDMANAIQDGAQEIDVVFPYQLFMQGNKTAAENFIRECKKSCGSSVLLKVILETGVLLDSTLISAASRCALIAGADFLKTSTGKVAIGATPEAARIMLLVIKEMTPQLNRPLGFKASGGIRTREQVMQYINIASEIMGTNWVTSEHFRIGTSVVPV